MIHPSVAQAIQELDAAIMNGDTFENPDARKELLEYIEAWKRTLAPIINDEDFTYRIDWSRGTMSKAITEWNLGCVQAVLQKEREIIGLDRHPYGVGEQSMTGGPVLRGPWGSIGGMQSQYTEYETKCVQFTAAYIHGHLAGARAACDAIGCIGYDTLPYCQRCGGNSPQKPTS